MTDLTSRRPSHAPAVLAWLPLALLAACSREPAPEAAAPPPSPAPVVAATPAPPPTQGAPSNRMDCMGAGGIRFALDFSAGAPNAFEYASSNPADRSIICRYIASEGDATSTWQRADDGSLTVEIRDASTAGAARFALAPEAGGWRVQIVAEPKMGQCFRTPPPNLMILTGRPGQECSLTARGGIASSANEADARQLSACAPERIEVAIAPSRSKDPAALFRELPEGIIGMSLERREAVLAAGGARLQQLDPAAGFLSIERELRSFEDPDDADGYLIGTFHDSSGRTVVAVSTISATAAKQGIWRSDATGWQKVGCDLIDDYRADHQYIPVASGNALDVYNEAGQLKVRLNWNGDRFVE